MTKFFGYQQKQKGSTSTRRPLCSVGDLRRPPQRIQNRALPMPIRHCAIIGGTLLTAWLVCTGAGCGRRRASPTQGTALSAYVVDLSGPSAVATTTGGADRASTNISRLDVYATGPAREIDSYLPIESVLALSARYETSDPAKIILALRALA